MNKIITVLTAITILTVECVFAQVPQAFKYQAIARDNSGNILANQNVSFRISILQGSISGPSMYTETQTATTNQFGLANLNIGNGTVVSGNFSTISWGSNIYFAKMEFDPAGGNSFTFMGTSQLLSVPYSLYAEKAGNVSYTDTSATNELQTLTQTGTNVTLSNGGGTISVNDGDTSATNELQTLTQTGTNVILSNGGGTISVYDGDSSSTNELQTLTQTGTSVTLSNGGGTISVNDGDTSLWKQNGSDIYYNVGNVGIGTNIPLKKLDVAGSVNIMLDSSYSINNQRILSVKGTNNLFVGEKAGALNTGHSNTAVGVKSLYANTQGLYNTAIGRNALVSNTTASGNTAIGVDALYSDTSGGSNTAAGYQALYNNTTGYFNTAIGSGAALYLNTTGVGNTAVGQDALHNNTTGNNNIAIGYGADVTTGALNNATAIGYNAKVAADNSLILGGTGAYAVNVGFGTTTPPSKVTVTGGDVNITDIASGIIMKSPNGLCWRVTIDNSGNLVRTNITCP